MCTSMQVFQPDLNVTCEGQDFLLAAMPIQTSTSRQQCDDDDAGPRLQRRPEPPLQLHQQRRLPAYRFHLCLELPLGNAQRSWDSEGDWTGQQPAGTELYVECVQEAYFEDGNRNKTFICTANGTWTNEGSQCLGSIILLIIPGVVKGNGDLESSARSQPRSPTAVSASPRPRWRGWAFPWVPRPPLPATSAHPSTSPSPSQPSNGAMEEEVCRGPRPT